MPCLQAYIKARGDGVGFAPLSRIHAHLPPNSTKANSISVQISVDGVLQDRCALGLGMSLEA